MQINVTDHGKASVVAPLGRIDQTSVDSFQQGLAPHLTQCTADSAALILDFSAVDYISSVGLRALMLAAKQVKAQGGRIAVAALHPIVREVFEISRFNLVLPVFNSTEDAAAAKG